MKKKVNYLKFATNGTNRHEQQNNNITKVRGVCLVRGLFSLLCAAAVLFTACFGFDERPDEFAAGFVAVEDITGVPTGGFPYVGLGLSATVEPHNATEKRIEWSIANQGGTQSSIDGSRLTANAEGTVTVTARIVNGKGEGEDFIKDFYIVISMVSPFKVTGILGIPAALPIEADTYTLHGTVEPSNAAHKNIVWSVLNQGGTGTTIDPVTHTLTAMSKGTVTLRATIVNGRLDEGDYTQDFPIHIYKTSVIASGYRDDYGSRYPVFWIDGELTELSAEGKSYARTEGVVFAGGRHYIAGYLADANSPPNAYLGYWVNGGNFIELDHGSMGGGTGMETRVHSIAVDAANDDVYITGRVNGTYCYWKIVDGVKEKRVDIPGGVDIGMSDFYGYPLYSGTYAGSIAAYNGSVYLPYKNTNDQKAYYLNEHGTAVPIPQLDDVYSILCVAVVNGNVYMGGEANNLGNNIGTPYYWQEGASAPTLLYDKTNRSLSGKVTSIVEQNGKPLFVGLLANDFSGTGFYYWDAQGNRNPILSDSSILDRAVSSDGDVFMPLSIGRNSITGRYRGGYVVIRGWQSSLVNNPYDAMYVTGIAVIDGDLLHSGSIANITAPSWREGDAVSLAAPQVSLSGQTVIEQGWQISDDGNEDWEDFTATTASMSHNGKYLRYYAKSSSGIMYHSNTVLIRVRSATANSGEIIIAMYHQYGWAWSGGGAIRIEVNGNFLTENASKIYGGNGPENYTFQTEPGDEVKLHWGWSASSQYAFAVYYSDDPPNPEFDPSTGTTDSGKILYSRLYNSYDTWPNGLFLTFTVVE